MANVATITTSSNNQNHVGSQIGQDDVPSMKAEETSKSEGTQAGGTLQQNNTASSKSTSTGTATRNKDYNDDMVMILIVLLCKKKPKGAWFVTFCSKICGLLKFKCLYAINEQVSLIS